MIDLSSQPKGGIGVLSQHRWAARDIFNLPAVQRCGPRRLYRIELGEIEAALEIVGQLSACAVVAIDAGGFEGATICCAYEPKNGAEVTARSLRGALGKMLPSYMVPTRWLAFDTLPKTANGKVDRQRLREEAGGWPLGRTAAPVATAPDPRAWERSPASSRVDEGV